MQSTNLNTVEQPYESCELKIDRIPFNELKRNDLVFHDNDIWRCQSVNMHIFQNLQTKQQSKIPISEDQLKQFSFLRIEKLELIPKEWKHIQQTNQRQGKSSAKIMLKGQQLGLGPIHQIEVMGMRRFEELQVVRSQKMKGREMAFKVILCRTKKANCYLIGGVQFLK